MKAFIIEGANWRQRIGIDDSLYEKYSDMVMEAMTQAIERIGKQTAENLLEKHADEEFAVGPAIVGWADEGVDESEEVIVLTEHIFRNAGCPKIAEALKLARRAR